MQLPNTPMNYECWACQRVIAEFEQVETKTLYLVTGDKDPWRTESGKAIRCPICKNQPSGPPKSYVTSKPVNIVPRCPHCKEIVDTINSKRTLTVWGELSVGKDGVTWGSDYGGEDEHGEEDPFPGAPERWEHSCPHCLKQINEPSSCLKPYAV